MFVLWFDDGFQCIKDHALTHCRKLGIKPVVAVNSRFAERSGRFWRLELSFLLERLPLATVVAVVLDTPQGKELTAQEIYRESSEQFNEGLRRRIGCLFEKTASPAERDQVDKLFWIVPGFKNFVMRVGNW